ncbi:MAG: peptide ABC transporter substrate-binding protein [Dehalococcoidia bacterium]
MNRLVLGILGVVAALVIAIGAVFILIIARDGDEEEGAEPQRTEEAEEPRQAGELRLSGADPITLDPALATDAASAAYIVEIFGGLVTLDRDLNLVPDLAAEIPTRENGGVVDNPDGTVTYTFHLRPDALFHDRRPVIADDVKYSLERAVDPRTGSVVAETYLRDIEGARDMARGRADEISGIEVVDDLTLRITIGSPNAVFLYKLTYPTAFVVDQRQVESNPRNWTRKPYGTGPYKMKEWRLGQRITLEANEDYHLGAPQVKTVRFLLAGGSILTMYENDDIDVAGVSVDDIERILDPSDPLNPEYVSGDELAIDYIGLNVNVPPFDDPKVRQAFAHAIDREKIAEVILKGVIPVADGLVPAGVPGYQGPSHALEFDPEKARQLLAESTYEGPENMPTITLAESGGGATVGPTSEAIIEMWRENLGVEVEMQQAEAATFFSDIDQGRYQMFHLGWIMDYPDPENVVDLLFYSTSRQNNSRYSNPEVDALLEQARGELDQQRRFELYSQAEQIIIDDTPWIPLFFSRTHALVKPYVKGYIFPPIVIPRLRYASVER